jgi:hypothetical protein
MIQANFNSTHVAKVRPNDDVVFFLKEKLCIKFNKELGLDFDFVPCLWQENFGLFTNIHLLLGLACILQLMDTMWSFLKFAQRRDIFICDFIDVMKVCKG